MSASEGPNPEHRSNNAILCLCIGLGLMFLAWLLGVGGVLSLAISGGDPTAAAGGLGLLIALPLMAVAGFVLALVGAVWIIVRVIADQRGESSEKRYRSIER